MSKNVQQIWGKKMARRHTHNTSGKNSSKFGDIFCNQSWGGIKLNSDHTYNTNDDKYNWLIDDNDGDDLLN